MWILSAIFFLTAAFLLVIAVLIYRGNTNLINDYHRGNVKDLPAYGRDFGKALAWMSVPLIVSGVMRLFPLDSTLSQVATLILLLGLALSFIPIVRVQRKHNGGMFS